MPMNKKVTIATIADGVLQRLKKQDMPAALNLLKQLADNQVGSGMSEARLLVEVARLVQGRYPAAALEIAREALTKEPELIDGLLIAGLLQDNLGNKQEARECMARVIDNPAAKPEQILIAANLLIRLDNSPKPVAAAFRAFDAMEQPLRWADSVLYIAMKVADWARVEKLTRQLAAAHAAGMQKEAREKPRNNVMWCADEAINLQILKNWSDTELKPKMVGHQSPEPRPLDGRRLRIGYLSSDFREHPTSRLINGLFRNHDKEKCELFMYCSGWDDSSALRKEVTSRFDHIHSVALLSDEDASNLIRSHQLDVLVELNGPTRSHRMGLLAYRPAPIQIDYMGWPGSVGGNVVDYVIGDSYTVPPGAEQLYPEKVIRIEKVYQVNDYLSMSLGTKPSRKDAGLPDDDRLVIGMFNAINKVHFEVWSVWMTILKLVPNAVLWLLDPGPVARKNIARWTKAAGVDTKRVIAAAARKQQEHLDRLQLCDLMLDPWPYGGHTSTSDALFAGVPVVALEGTNFAGRVSGALLKAAGMEVLVCKDKKDYVQKAVGLLRNPAELAKVKAFLKQNVPTSDVFDAPGKARQFEAVYEYVTRRCLAGGAPVHLAVHNGKVEPYASTAVAPQPGPPVQGDSAKLPLILVCGPWSSGTSAVAGLLAQAGLQAPGPYVKVNDPKTADTYEMKAFQTVLQSLASEDTLQRLAGAAQALAALQRFRDDELRPRIAADNAAPLLLKHGLAPLFLPELDALFEVRIVGVLRPLEAIEATRLRRKWKPSLGRQGAEVIYQVLFRHLINGTTPFHLVRYPQLLSNPEVEFDQLAKFCGIAPAPQQRAAALAFVARPAPAGTSTTTD